VAARFPFLITMTSLRAPFLYGRRLPSTSEGIGIALFFKPRLDLLSKVIQPEREALLASSWRTGLAALLVESSVMLFDGVVFCGLSMASSGRDEAQSFITRTCERSEG
jgi:hypothetical protein